MEPPDPATLAHHESGHWVIAHHFKSMVGSISIVWDQVTLSQGRAEMGDLTAKFRWSYLFDISEAVKDPRYRRAAENQATMHLAGVAAATRYRGRRTWRGAREDLRWARRYIAPLHEDDSARKAHVHHVCLRARDLVLANWDLVEALAEAVRAAGSLDRERALAVVLKAREGSL